jgi:hypothetical protein
MPHLTTGGSNVTTGDQALFSNQTGNGNTAIGNNALGSEKAASWNTAVGADALANDRTGSLNLALGQFAGFNLTDGQFNVDIANRGETLDTQTMRIGTPGQQTRTFLAGVSGQSIAGPAQPVLVNAKGRLGTATGALKSQEASGAAVDKLRAQNRRQAARIATLKREVSRLSRR